jgi:hypothetical protein
MKWTAEVMTDPMRDHKLHVELSDDGHFRGRLYLDELGKLQLQIYAGSPSTMPVDWLVGIIHRYSDDVKTGETTAETHGQAEKAIA